MGVTSKPSQPNKKHPVNHLVLIKITAVEIWMQLVNW